MPPETKLEYFFLTAAVLSAVAATSDMNEEGPKYCVYLKFYVDCSKKNIEVLPHMPSWTKQLDLADNKISSLPENVLDNLENLQILKLKNNLIESIPHEFFKNLSNLKVLVLNNNNLRTLKYNMFQGLLNLTKLKLKHNKLTAIPSGSFYGFKVLDVLQLDHNNIQVISKGLFGLESVTNFSLSHNTITKIDDDCWEQSSNIESLDLSYNNIKALNGSTFKHLKSLKVLILSHNEIASISQDTFGHTQSLEILKLDNNGLSWTVEDMAGPFSKLHNLRVFILSFNQIKSISSKAFEGLSTLVELDLRGNKLSSIQPNAFSSLTNVRKIMINSTSMLCDCKLQWIAKWININKIDKKYFSGTCGYPSDLKGRFIYQLKDVNCGDSPKPDIILHPSSQKAIKGISAHLVCSATSHPFSNMTFEWRKNDVTLTDLITAENIIETNDSVKVVKSELTIPNVTHNDNGKYQCIVSNKFGLTYSNKAELKMVIFPKFTKTPTNVTVKTGATVSLSCAASGDPTPEISWKKDGGNDFPAARERRMRVMPKDPIFFIISVKLEDMGVYSCAAKNSGGTIISNVTVTVLQPPSVNRQIERKEVNSGDEVVIQCMVARSLKSQLKWLKNGEPFVPSSRHFFTAEDQLLIIVKTQHEDAGKYECENDLGNDNRVTELVVTSATEDMTGIIIITVVCCAVGTSIIWVVIIYQTRRKMARAVPSFPPESINMTNLHIDGDNCVHMFPDNISEPSSCKDSGTGDSAQQNSFDDVLSERNEIQCHTPGPGVQSFSPPSENRRLLPSSFKPTIQVCVNTSVSPATYSFSSHSDKDIS